MTHIILNAGGGDFLGLNWAGVVKQVSTDFMGAVTAPMYKLQGLGRMSKDNLGWVWQLNVFGHYLMVRFLEFLVLFVLQVNHPAKDAQP